MKSSIENVPYAPRPFPWRCLQCGKDEVRPATVRYETKVKHHGKMHEVCVPELSVLQCAHCGEFLFGSDADEQIARALRTKVGLLQPDEIVSKRNKRGWTQAKLAEAMSSAVATVSRWESGTLIQSVRSDKHLRQCLDGPGLDVAEPDPALVVSDEDSLATISREIDAWCQEIRQSLFKALSNSPYGRDLSGLLVAHKDRWADFVTHLASDKQSVATLDLVEQIIDNVVRRYDHASLGGAGVGRTHNYSKACSGGLLAYRMRGIDPALGYKDDCFIISGGEKTRGHPIREGRLGVYRKKVKPVRF
jgi:transcriptional regulator with XRE-family HTH domain